MIFTKAGDLWPEIASSFTFLAMTYANNMRALHKPCTPK